MWAVVVASGRRMPLDPEATPDGNIVLLEGTEPDGALHIAVLPKDQATLDDADRYRSHFSTCPYAGSHRRS